MSIKKIRHTKVFFFTVSFSNIDEVSAAVDPNHDYVDDAPNLTPIERPREQDAECPEG